MEFVKARPDQFSEIVRIFEHVKEGLREQGIDQWTEDYPDREILQKDIGNGNMYLLVSEGEIAAIAALDQNQEPQYEDIPWKDKTGNFLVVHRLCVNPDYQGKGISRLFMDEIERFAKDQGYSSIRLDTQMVNEKAMNLYESHDYEKRGTFYFPHASKPFMAFEKKLVPKS
ncbi:MAG: GNAT family N-acetyltransferase [Thermoactinomyces sp.]